VRVVAACTRSISKRLVLDKAELVLFHLLMTTGTHLPLRQSEVVLLIRPMGAVTDRTDSGSKRTVNIGSVELLLFSFVASIAKVSARREKFVT